VKRNLCLSIVALYFLTNQGSAGLQDRQPAATQNAAPATATVEIMSTSVVDSVDGIQRDRWLPENPSSNKGLVVRVRVARGFGYSTADFGLTFQSAGKAQKVPCIGVTARLPDGWVFNDSAKGWSVYPGGNGTLEGLGFLFLLPNDVREVTLLYKDRPAGNPAPVKRD
jgi:hypothetical protein